MTSSPTVHVDVQRLYEDLRTLLYERFRCTFLNRGRRGGPTPPSTVIEAATRHFLFDRPDTRREIQEVVDEHTIEGPVPRSQVHHVYAPELMKSLVYDIGREARVHRYDGPVQAELKVKESTVSLHQIRPP